MPFATKPPRCTLANVVTGETLACAFNPTELSERIEVGYQRLAGIAQGFEQLQYTNTKNRTVPNVEFYADAFNRADLTPFREFLRALTVPVDGAPPGVLLVWPNVLSMEAVVTDLGFKYTQFAADGGVLVYTASLTFEESARRSLLGSGR